MPKQQKALRYVAKIHSERFRKAKLDLHMGLDELVHTNSLVSLGDSQILDFIDEIRGFDSDAEALLLKARIKWLSHRESDINTTRELKALRMRLREIMYRDDYLLVIMDSIKDFEKMCADGVTFNGVKRRFLLATTGGVKESVMIFVKEDMYDELVRRINNGRDEGLPYIPAKLEAYMSLVCSASVPVSSPRGVLVVDDCVTSFIESAIRIRDNDDGGEPIMEVDPQAQIELTDSDGYGLMCPALAARWAVELGEGDMVSGVNTRCAYEKGMLFTFDFHRFADEIARRSMVCDVWGNEHDIHDVEMILTVSMLKLWDAYKSWDDYWQNCQRNGYTFRVTKVCPQKLEHQRTTNYQFIQPYDFTDEQMRRLIEPTIYNIREAVSGDWVKTLLYITGDDTSEKVWRKVEPNWQTAIRINPDVMQDQYVINRIHKMIQVRIDEAKVGTLDIAGNYSIISGDPYSLCQHVFGLEVTGLLKAGECYHKYWSDLHVERIACFRAPMSVGNNIRTLRISATPEQQDWYQYMRTCTILNSWDATCHALNGADE